jgi:hypothetical protein
MNIVWAAKEGRLWVILALDIDGQLIEFAGRTFPEAARVMSRHQNKSAAEAA